MMVKKLDKTIENMVKYNRVEVTPEAIEIIYENFAPFANAC